MCNTALVISNRFRYYFVGLLIYFIVGILIKFSYNNIKKTLVLARQSLAAKVDVSGNINNYNNRCYIGGKYDLVLIPEGEFQMGGKFEHPIHRVRVVAVLMDSHEVCKEKWDQVAKWANNHGYDLPQAEGFGGPDHPVIMVNWYDAVKWCNARSEMQGLCPCYYEDNHLIHIYRSGIVEPYVKWKAGYRLPTEAEWEKGAKGGDDRAEYPFALDSGISAALANYKESKKYGTVPTGSYGANAYGLYDMAGNVREWCWDLWAHYDNIDSDNPPGPLSGKYRVTRGGSWLGDRERCRVSYRYYFYSRLPIVRDYQTGFRSVIQISE